MRRTPWTRLVPALAFLVVLAALAGAQEDAEDARTGVFIRLTANSLRITDQGLLLAVRDDPGGRLEGEALDASWDQRIIPGIQLGFVLPNQRDIFQIGFLQVDETLNIGETDEFQNTWSSREAGFFEDLDGDGDVDGFDCGGGTVPGGTVPCESDGDAETILDGAEDLNRNGQADFLRFDRSDSLLSEIQTEMLVVDLDYIRVFRNSDRFRLEGMAGLRIFDISQDADVMYRQSGSFAAYTDAPEDSSRINSPDIGYDGDGDGFDADTSGDTCTKDCVGDGWGNGNNTLVRDDLLDIPTVDEDQIRARVEATGAGLTLGVRGEYTFKGKNIPLIRARDFERSWALISGMRLGVLRGSQDFSYREVLQRERDALPNFMDWDFNGDGVFGEGPSGHDFDCNGDGQITPVDWSMGNCTNPNLPPGFNLGSMPLTGVAAGFRDSIFPTGSGYPDNPYDDDTLDEGDPVPESERNTTIARTTSVVRDLEGSNSSEIFTTVDLDLGLRWYFSRFADLEFGARASRWFDIGNVKNVRSNTSAEALTEGDLTLTGLYVTLTVRPRLP